MEINFSNIKGITTDSRQAKPGYIFVAIKGTEQDGHMYIDQAIKNGASLIIHQEDTKKEPYLSRLYIKVKNSRLALSELSAKIYPKQSKYILGVTGTSGKTSTVHFTRELLRLLGKKIVSIGSLGVLGEIEIQTNINTPPADKLHQLLQEIADKNIDYVAMECSSHGIDQHRLTSVKYTACAFTNLSRDHLDYHENMEEYFDVKKRLFEVLKSGYAVLNIDTPEYNKLHNLCLKQRHKIISYGKNELADIQITSINNEQIIFKIKGKSYPVKINLIGEFQIYNIACAIALVATTGVEYEEIMPLLPMLTLVPGRMEQVAPNIFVDYAHKPEALEKVLQALKANTQHKLYLLFGCGGNRDQGKRSIMGEIACKYADFVIITDDNPRNENPAEIRKAILDGCNNKAVEIADRAEAIKFAVSQLKQGDKLLIAGKGHETYQIVGNNTQKFSDKDEVIKCLSKI